MFDVRNGHVQAVKRMSDKLDLARFYMFVPVKQNAIILQVRGTWRLAVLPHAKVPGSNPLGPKEFLRGVCMFLHVCAGTPVSSHSPNTCKGQPEEMMTYPGCTLSLTPKGID